MKKKIILFPLLTLVFASCMKNINTDADIETTNELDSNYVLAEMADVIGSAGEELPFTMIDIITTEGDEFETIYAKNLVKNETKSAESVSSVILNEIHNNSGQYPNLSELLISTKSSNTGGIESIPAEYYMPNSEMFNPDEEEYVTVGHLLSYTEDWTYGYRYSRDGEKEYVERIDEKYLEDNCKQ